MVISSTIVNFVSTQLVVVAAASPSTDPTSVTETLSLINQHASDFTTQVALSSVMLIQLTVHAPKSEISFSALSTSSPHL
jgi:hypothetical protein